jgi:hypothetical protein
MIFFIPAYDEATRANLSVITSIIPENSIQLLDQRATRENLWQHLNNNDILFAMSHGNSDVIWDNNDEAALIPTDNINFVNKRAFVFACFTANELGQHLKSNQSIYWGYTGSIAAPSDQIELLPLFTPIFQQIITHFPNCKDILEINSLLNTLKTFCNNAENAIDILWETNDTLDVMSSYNCLNHIWNRLRVHHFEHETPIQHPHAEIGDLFE